MKFNRKIDVLLLGTCLCCFGVSPSFAQNSDKGSYSPALSNSVNLDDATYSNDIGATQLSASWIDPDFDPDIDAFYYVRVLEIPTPRWSTFDAVRFGVELPDSVPATLQERAYSSPIWYDTNN